MTTVGFEAADPWPSPSSDPNDETFGDVVERATPQSGTPEAVTEAVADYDVVLLGEPYDGAVIGRRGARDGPAAIRNVLAGVKTHHFDRGPVGHIGDLGNLSWETDAVADVQRETARMSAALYETDTLPVFVGGDNSLTVGNVTPLLDRGSVGVVNFDAHLDCREPVDGPTSGTPYRQLLRAGLDAYAVVGARHFETSTHYADWLSARGGELVTATAVGADFTGALDRVWQAVEDVEQLYVSVDLDVLDATAAPAVSAPTPGGLLTRELFSLLRQCCSDPRLTGFEVVECAPSLAEGTQTADAAARAIAHGLAGATVKAGDAGRNASRGRAETPDKGGRRD